MNSHVHSFYWRRPWPTRYYCSKLPEIFCSDAYYSGYPYGAMEGSVGWGSFYSVLWYDCAVTWHQVGEKTDDVTKLFLKPLLNTMYWFTPFPCLSVNTDNASFLTALVYCTVLYSFFEHFQPWRHGTMWLLTYHLRIRHESHEWKTRA